MLSVYLKISNHKFLFVVGVFLKILNWYFVFSLIYPYQPALLFWFTLNYILEYNLFDLFIFIFIYFLIYFVFFFTVYLPYLKYTVYVISGAYNNYGDPDYMDWNDWLENFKDSWKLLLDNDIIPYTPKVIINICKKPISYIYILVAIFILILIKLLMLYIILIVVNINLLKVILIFVPLILSIAFFTLYERKILASMQRRRGPNNVGLYGLLQAIADGLKLLFKETIIPSASNIKLFLLAPIFTFMLSLLGWAVIQFDISTMISSINLGVLFVLVISSLQVYGIIIAGWASNSKYAFLGALRSAAQMMSYEISMVLLILPVILYTHSFHFKDIVSAQTGLFYDTLYLWNVFFFFVPAMLFFISILAETNRIPFDLPEAESELVSGYNVEYSSIIFAFFFLAEYSSILLMCTFYTLMFFGGYEPLANYYFLSCIPGWLWFASKVLIFMFLIIWIRATVPRYRYDQLMGLGWKVMLPLSFGVLFAYVGIYLILIA